MSASASSGTISILIAALGGEGGGVLMNWIVDCAIAAGMPVQSTSVPGVAQRTGSTSYYIEIGEKGGIAPVFALVPMAGRVDVVIASELAEAGRMLERGFVSPNRTTLITGTARVLTTAEKMQMADGRFPSERILEAGAALAKRFLPLDFEGITRQAGTVVSAPMFGALAGAGVFPWSREACEAMLVNGRGAKASLAGFAAAYAAVGGEAKAAPLVAPPPDVRTLGRDRCRDYMDQAYADLFEARIARLSRAAGDLADPLRAHALEEATRRLALWMTYEDIPRVADLKTRPERFTRIAREAEMREGQLLKVADLFKPGVEELAAMLPVRWGEWLMTHHRKGGQVPFLGKGMHLGSTTIVGHLALKFLARMGRLRRRSLRFRDEQAAIEQWLGAMEKALPAAPAYAGALAELPRLLKGYGETQARGLANYKAIFSTLVTPILACDVEDADAPALRKAIGAALADPDGVALSATLAPPSAQPMVAE
ncbi:MAG: indolepyruvate oxidoreductase subunit B [Rhizobiales bacterium PAR1]|nr:MAG: indolepyruvate oxidoreductase subunit B [Rhizobiales bacterium PAR1]